MGSCDTIQGIWFCRCIFDQLLNHKSKGCHHLLTVFTVEPKGKYRIGKVYALFLDHKIVDHKIVDRLALVVFQSLLVTFFFPSKEPGDR